jgi:L-fucose mutarotase
MLLNIDPVLIGPLLAALDEMGHGDAVVIADAHFTGVKLAKRPLLDLPGLSSPRVLAAIRSVLAPDDGPTLDLMASPAPDLLPVQRELIAAAEVPETDVRLIERFAFYDIAAKAELIIRTGETRTYGNALFYKGVTPVDPRWALA